ncbi:general stress protein [Terrarubrum flagellatum]|uniref:general stress protein n=1 Tax=Terrirubrum flagellatum TaxID=2895980 RepID=UPI0031454896
MNQQHGHNDQRSGQNQQYQQGANKQQNAGNFANDPKRAAEAGRKGGERSHGGKGQQQT